MKILVLWASDRDPNLGVRVLGVGTKALARMAWPGCDVSFHSFGAGSAPVRLGSPRELLKEAVTKKHHLHEWFTAFDVVLDTRAGDSFADIYGMRRHVAMCGALEFARRQGVRVVLSPQTIGPFETVLGRWIGRRSLRGADLVMARDSKSAAVADRLGRRVDLVTTDVVFALEAPPAAAVRDAILNISGLLWQPNPHVDYREYREAVSSIYRRLTSEGRVVSLLAHVLPSANQDNDVPAVQEFQRIYAPEAEALIPKSLDDVRSMLAGSNFVVGSRMHACLNAMSVGVPAIPLAYSRKFAPLMNDLGWPYVVDLREHSGGPADSVVRLSCDPSLQRRTQDLRAAAAGLIGRAAATLSELAPAPAR